MGEVMAPETHQAAQPLTDQVAAVSLPLEVAPAH